MKKVLKLFIASLLTVSLSLATVMCCCIGSALIAHFHKAVVCSHCPDQNTNSHPSSPPGDCQHQLTSAEFSYSQTSVFYSNSDSFFHAPIFSYKYITTLPPSSSLAYPPGSPPQRIIFTPLYLRTFNLRI